VNSPLPADIPRDGSAAIDRAESARLRGVSLVRLQHAAGVPLGHSADGNRLHHLHRRVVHDNRGVIPRESDVDALAVRRDGEPVRMAADFDYTKQLVVRQRVRHDGVVILARRPQHLSIRCDSEAVSG